MRGRPTSPSPSMCGFGGEAAKWPHAAGQETVAAFLCWFGMSNPARERKNSFLLRVCFIDEASGE